MKSKEILYQPSSQNNLDTQYHVSNQDSNPILDTQSLQESQSSSDLPVVHARPRKKRRTGVENLIIVMKGWNYVVDYPNIVVPFVNNSFQDSKDEMMLGAAADKSLNESGCVQHRETEIDCYEIFDDMINDIPYDVDLCLI